MSIFLSPELRRDALRTDLYQLTMAAALFRAGLKHEASFELFTRRLAPRRGYWIACGLEPALDYLEGLRFSDEQISYLKGLPEFAQGHDDFLDYLRDFRFKGEVWAVAEGTPVFPWEPLVRVTAPAIQAQIVETYLLSLINFQTLIASKAARVDSACQGKAFVDFGTRRAHGPEAGELVARASYLAGAAGTSNVEAGMQLGIPVFGTFAHAWVMSFADEDEAFVRYAESFPSHTTLLIDTYDTVAAARRIVSKGLGCQAVRLDSGDLCQLSKDVREVFDAGKREEIKIIASNDLNEERIEELEAGGCAIDIYGVGTELATSRDFAALGGVYKLVETRLDGVRNYPIKLSASKKSWPGRKQVYRQQEGSHYSGDLIALADQTPPPGAPLLEQVMLEGEKLRPSPPLAELKEACASKRRLLPDAVKAIQNPAAYAVERSPELIALADRMYANARSESAEKE